VPASISIDAGFLFFMSAVLQAATNGNLQGYMLKGGVLFSLRE
jgi:hypothetical protein